MIVLCHFQWIVLYVTKHLCSKEGFATRGSLRRAAAWLHRHGRVRRRRCAQFLTTMQTYYMYISINLKVATLKSSMHTVAYLLKSLDANDRAGVRSDGARPGSSADLNFLNYFYVVDLRKTRI